MAAIAKVAAKMNFETLRKNGLTKSIITTFGKTWGIPREYCMTLDDAFKAYKNLKLCKDLFTTVFPSIHFPGVKISNLNYSKEIDPKDRNNCRAYYSFTMSISSKIKSKEVLLDAVLLELAYRIPFIASKEFENMSISADSSDLRFINIGVMIEGLAAK